jgi:hypothetical protein
MKKLIAILLVVALSVGLGVVSAALVSAEGNGGSGIFVTGGGNIREDNTVTWTFGGKAGYVDGVGVGQFQIVDHANKESWHCNNDFTSIVFSGSPIVGPPGPSAGCSIATFTGNFTSNTGGTATLTVVITDVNEPGKDNDTIEVTGDFEFSGDPISGGNFQIHGELNNGGA